MDAFPLGSKGSSRANNPEKINNAPLMKMGIDDVRGA